MPMLHPGLAQTFRVHGADMKPLRFLEMHVAPTVKLAIRFSVNGPNAQLGIRCRLPVRPDPLDLTHRCLHSFTLLQYACPGRGRRGVIASAQGMFTHMPCAQAATPIARLFALDR